MNTSRSKLVGSTFGLRMIALVVVGVPTATLARDFVNAYPGIERFVGTHAATSIARLLRPIGDAVLATGGRGTLRMYKSREDFLVQLGES